MHLDPVLPALFAVAAMALIVGLALRRFNQPHVVSYILVGVVLGPSALGYVANESAISQFGALGVVMLLFFVGMEVSPDKLIAKWRIALLGTLFQVLLSFGAIWMVGHWFDWPFGRIVLMTFVITLSSTAVVLKLLQQWQQLDTPVGQNVLSILLVQDFAVVPMMVAVSLFSGADLSPLTVSKQLLGAGALIALAAWVTLHRGTKQALPAALENDAELQLFAALSVCFGLAVISGWLELSSALGAFVAGLVVGQRYETHWLHTTLAPLRDLFVALFFLSIGLLIDLQFVFNNVGQLLLLVGAVLFVNTLINTVILRAFGEHWKDAVYGGVILSQVGEFSFVLAAVGLSAGLIEDSGYQMTLALIALSLALSPAYIALTRTVLGPRMEQAL